MNYTFSERGKFYMSKKWTKYLLVLSGIGAAIGLALAFFKKKNSAADTENEFSDSFEDEDFDLDKDLEPITNRDYIALDS